MTVAVTGGKIGLCEHRAGPQDVIDQTQVLKKHRPIKRRNQAHAGHDVAHADVRRRLELMFFTNRLIQRGALSDQAFLEPTYDLDALWFFTKALHELHHEGTLEWTLRETAAQILERFGSTNSRSRIAQAQQPIGERIGPLAFLSGRDDTFGQATQVLDQHHPQGNR